MASRSSGLGTLTEDRKARLAKLKSLKRKQPTDEIVSPQSTREGSAPLPQPQQALPTSLPSSQQDAPTPAPAPEIHAADSPEDGTQNQEDQEDQLDPEADVSRIILSGRNYDPEVRGPILGFEAPPVDAETQPTLEGKAAEIESEVKERSREEEHGEGVDLFKLQPKKPNWDLKRDLQRKLDVLNTKTQNAINKIVRERIEAGRKDARRVDATGEKEQKGVGQDGEGVDGVALVEGLKVREREEEEQERREREDIENAT